MIETRFNSFHIKCLTTCVLGMKTGPKSYINMK